VRVPTPDALGKAAANLDEFLDEVELAPLEEAINAAAA
jgi:hypothetical protein